MVSTRARTLSSSAAEREVPTSRGPNVIVAEFEYRGTAAGTGEPAAVPCVFVLRVRGGVIVESRDYVDHVAGARVRGRLPE